MIYYLKKQNILKRTAFFIFSCFLFHAVHAGNLRQISSRDGLSNSSVIFLFQDSERFLWIGTFDGLNMYDGRDIHVYKPNISKNNTLSGNVIRKIVETENSYLWISTKWGLNKLSKKHNIIEEYYDEFKDDSRIVRDRHDNLYVIGKKGLLSVYDRRRKMFRDIPINPEIECQNITGCFIDANDTLYINHRGVMEKYAILHRDSSMSEIVRCEDYRHPLPIDNAFHDRDRILFVNRAGDLYIINQVRTFYAGNHAALFRENGLIASIIMHGSDILAGFKTNGLYCLRAQKNYEPEKIDINCGVFSLLKDEAQDIVWIGTDGQGVYAWTNDDYTFAGINLSQLPVRKERPVRAIYADSLDYLWMGTKDNGILRIKNHHAAREYTGENVRHFTTATGLSNDAVFAFAKSRSGEVLWIGSDGPDINYYSYRDDRIHTLANHSPTGFDYIHSLFETSDSVLWAGAGSSLLKIALRKTPDGYEAASCRQYDFNLKNRQTFNQIFALHSENDSIIWIGIRGNGLVRFNALSGDYRLITFDENGIAPMNDILCIHRDRKNNFWIGSSYGITRLRMNGDGTFDCKNYNENSGLPNNTVHGILENADGELWLSSNNGIILFNPVNETFRTFNQKTGLKVVEFCDNAYFYDSRTAECFFGGVDGIVRIKNDAKQIRRFIPEIHFTRLRIFNSEYNIRDFEKGREGDSRIELNHNQNSFAISFVALDYVYGENGKYSYNLENFSSVWMNTSSNEAQFTNIPPGSYTLNVKYDDGTMPGETPVSRIAVIIHPPWYVTLPMKTFYVALALGLLFLIRLFIKKQYEEKKRNMARTLDEKYREELQERKLRFFTNITHEFCTPLTLIYGPCMRILNHEGCDASVLRYAGIIRSNAIRLNGLIQEVIDFRRMETGHRICHIQSLDINEILSELTDSFNEPAEHNGINFQTRIEPDMIWNTDCGCFTKILNNLISNAFKYTPPKGDITVTIYRE
ncbi:MAG: hybrid sensor histidine kinase/response regulator, partial [Tannerella sp.]|nr:hybrid sensor histidine kinase/response regulator [Tannerella sp.]